jgi:hypothetical protein
MPDRKLVILCLSVLVLLGGACSPSVSVQKIPAGTVQASKTAPPFPAETSLFSSRDTDLFTRALSYLSVPPGGQVSADDYANARSDFESLLNAYPKSKWRPASEEFILLIDGITSSRQLAEKSLAEKTKLTQDNEQLKRQVRTLNEKLQTDTAALMQENEQLKKDIQKMKNLDIELEKRDRQLR